MLVWMNKEKFYRGLGLEEGAFEAARFSWNLGSWWIW